MAPPPQPRRSGRRVIRMCLLPITLLADALQARGLRCIAPERLTRKRPVAGRAVTPRIRLDPPARDPNAAITPHPHKISLAREGFGTARYRGRADLKRRPYVWQRGKLGAESERFTTTGRHAHSRASVSPARGSNTTPAGRALPPRCRAGHEATGDAAACLVALSAMAASIPTPPRATGRRALRDTTPP